MQWLLEQYRSERTRALVNQTRAAVAQMLMPPDSAPRAVPVPASVAEDSREGGSPDALAGMCRGITLRDLSLVDSLLAQLEDMEATEGDPDALALLYQLDHLAARMRRNAEKLRVLAGHDAGDAASAASPLVDVIRAGMSSIEQYRRIAIGRVAPLAVVDLAADDVSRLLAELLDNATSHSPPESKVAVSAHLTEHRDVLLRIEDAGVGLPADRLRALNAALRADPVPGSGSTEHMGLGVVRRLADKHNIRVRLDKRATHGTTAAVLLPASVLCEAPARPWFAGAATKAPQPPPAPADMDTSAPSEPEQSSTRTGQAKTLAAPRTTRNGLPRRVPRSLREFASLASTVPSPRDDPDSVERRDLLMTDLGDFSEGEHAARQGAPRRTATGEQAEESRE